MLLGNGPRTRRCKAIGIDKEEEEEEFNRQLIKTDPPLNTPISVLIALAARVHLQEGQSRRLK